MGDEDLPAVGGQLEPEVIGNQSQEDDAHDLANKKKEKKRKSDDKKRSVLFDDAVEIGEAPPTQTRDEGDAVGPVESFVSTGGDEDDGEGTKSKKDKKDK